MVAPVPCLTGTHSCAMKTFDTISSKSKTWPNSLTSSLPAARGRAYFYNSQHVILSALSEAAGILGSAGSTANVHRPPASFKPAFVATHALNEGPSILNGFFGPAEAQRESHPLSSAERRRFVKRTIASVWRPFPVQDERLSYRGSWWSRILRRRPEKRPATWQRSVVCTLSETFIRVGCRLQYSVLL